MYLGSIIITLEQLQNVEEYLDDVYVQIECTQYIVIQTNLMASSTYYHLSVYYQVDSKHHYSESTVQVV